MAETFTKVVKNIFRKVLLTLAMTVAGVCALSAQEAQETRRGILDSIASLQEDWETVSLTGKLRMAGLPLSPSVKIWMERDSSVIISLHAPFMGEVGRAEIYADTLLVVNKMKKTYVAEPLGKVLENYPGTLADVQDILLGRPVVPGFGLLSPESADVVEIFREKDGGYSLIPRGDAEIEGFNYGYLFDSCFRPVLLAVLPLSRPETIVTLNYEFGNKGYDLTVAYESPDKNKGGTLELSYPVSGGQRIEPIKLNRRYMRLGFEDFMKSF